MEYNLTNIIDLHIHTHPDIHPRQLNDIEACEAAKAAGMKAVLIKSHVVLTADRAMIAEKVVGGIRAFGGLSLNTAIGGFNLEAVDMAIRMNAKVIWMPTYSAQNIFTRDGKNGGLSILGEDRQILPCIKPILDLINQANIAIATGHLSVEESIALVRLAKSMQLKKVIVTHPESGLIRMPVSIQQELSGPGVFFERCYLDTIPSIHGESSIEEIGHHIRAVGHVSTILSTDLGQSANPAPVEGMSNFLVSLQTIGFKKEEIFRMASINPTFIVDL